MPVMDTTTLAIRRIGIELQQSYRTWEAASPVVPVSDNIYRLRCTQQASATNRMIGHNLTLQREHHNAQ